jgi:DMSO/TMAO reductase YedYZ molybdopterin-dependent catalytic subunit
MPLFRSQAEDKVRAAGYDPARLPPGQYLTEKWPVLHAGSVPEVDVDTWRMRIFGLVEEEVTLGYEQLRALPATDVTTDIHCVTRWSRFDAGFRGVHWRELAALCKPLPAARFVIAHAPQNFTANLPLSALDEDDAMVCYEADGEPLTAEHGGPVRLFVPSRYFWKSAKWLTGLELVAADQPGFWERLGYHNDADPFREERYGF